MVFFAFSTSYVPGLASGTNASQMLLGQMQVGQMLLGDSGERERKDEERERQIKREAAGRDGYICISFCIHENNHNPLIE